LSCLAFCLILLCISP